MKNRKFIVLGMTLISLLLLGSVVYAATSGISINVDGNYIETDVEPQITEGRTMVPLRAISENFGADVSWDSETRTVEIVSPSKEGFHSGIVLNVDGDDYYLDGPPIEEGAEALDVPGHEWVQTGPSRVVGLHFNTGPFGAEQWWSSDAADGELLYTVDGIIDEWTEEKAENYADRGYVHYHELVSVDDGETFHPDKVVWLKHTARTSFNLDGGPMPEMAHEVTPGIDYEFMPNYMMPYPDSPEEY